MTAFRKIGFIVATLALIGAAITYFLKGQPALGVHTDKVAVTPGNAAIDPGRAPSGTVAILEPRETTRMRTVVLPPSARVAPIFERFPEVEGMPMVRRSAYFDQLSKQKIRATLDKYSSALEAMPDLVSRAREGDAGAALAAEAIADQCALVAVSVRERKKTQPGAAEECEKIGYDNLASALSLLLDAAAKGDPLAKFRLTVYPYTMSGIEYVSALRANPELWQAAQRETLAAHLYYEPLGSYGIISNIGESFSRDNVFPVDPVMSQAYAMASYSLARGQGVNEQFLNFMLTDARFGIDARGAGMSAEQRSAAVANAQAILNRCCSGIALTPELQARGK